MKAFEASKKLGMTNKDFCAEYNLSSHLCKISDELEAELFGGKQETKEEVKKARKIRFAVPPKKKVWTYKRKR